MRSGVNTLPFGDMPEPGERSVNFAMPVHETEARWPDLDQAIRPLQTGRVLPRKPVTLYSDWKSHGVQTIRQRADGCGKFFSGRTVTFYGGAGATGNETRVRESPC